MRISVITVVMNDKSGLEKTMNSVWNQTYSELELIVIDGGSKDGTAEYIGSVVERLDSAVSEPDGGIYDAMNKGLERAGGDFVLFLNAGDVLAHPGVLFEIVVDMDEVDAVYFGRAENLSSADSWYHPPYSHVDSSNVNEWLQSNLPNHQSMLFPKAFYKNNRYSLRFRIWGDADYKHRAFQECSARFVDTVVTRFQLGGVSSGLPTLRHAIASSFEGTALSLKYTAGLRRYLIAARRTLVPFSKFLLRKLLGRRYWSLLKSTRR